jgi:hypothetical protein
MIISAEDWIALCDAIYNEYELGYGVFSPEEDDDDLPEL